MNTHIIHQPTIFSPLHSLKHTHIHIHPLPPLPRFQKVFFGPEEVAIPQYGSIAEAVGTTRARTC